MSIGSNKRLCSILVSLLFSSLTFGQIVGGESFLMGDYLEVGISSCGSYGTVSQPAGYHGNTTGGLGFVADADEDGWTTGTPNYCGDYFLPGSPVEGWGVQVGADIFMNGNDGTICSPADITGVNISNTSLGL